MSAFLTKLKAELVNDHDPKQDGRPTWRLLAPFQYQSDLLGKTITVPEGFVTDFASVPRLPLTWYLAGGEADQAATIHDFLYHSDVPRDTADAVFREAMAVDGQPAWRRNGMWAMVRLFGAKPYAADHLDDQQPKGDAT